MKEKGNRLILAAAVLGTIYGCIMLWHIFNSRRMVLFERFIEFSVPLVILLLIGVILNLAGFVTRKRIIVVIAIIFYSLSALCVGRLLVPFAIVGMWPEIVSFFAKYSLPVLPSIILCITGLKLQKTSKQV